MKSGPRALLKILVLVPAAVLASVLAIGPGGLVSYSPATRVGVNSLLAYWIAIPMIVGVLSYRTRKIRATLLTISTFAFPMAMHIGKAAYSLSQIPTPEIEHTLLNTAADMAELSLLSLLLLAGAICYSRPVLADRPRRAVLFFAAILFTPLAIRGLLWFFVITVLPSASLTALVWLLATLGGIGILGTLFLVPRMKLFELPLDLGYFVSAVILVLLSSLSLAFSMSLPWLSWEFAETLQMAGFVLFSVSTGIPFIRRYGYTRRFAYGLVVGLILLFYLPLVITIGIESLGLGIVPATPNILAYAIIHIGAGSLSAMMAVLLYFYSKHKFSWTYYPLVLMFGLWAGLTFVLLIAFLLPSFAVLGEPTGVYIVGAMLTLLLLHVAARYEIRPPSRTPSVTRLLGALGACFTAVIVGEGLNHLFQFAYPSFIDVLLGEAILLITSLLVIPSFTYLIFLLAQRARGKMTAALYLALLLVVWILPSILKSYYPVWTLGWWVSEIMLLMGIVVGPPILAWLYIGALDESKDLHARSSLFADLLMHDVTNYNQVLMTSLELLGSSKLDDEQRARLASDGRQIISFADQLIQNVRLLTETDRLSGVELEPTNLTAAFVAALDYFTQNVGSDNVRVEFDPDEARAMVLANELLTHVFLNLLYYALEPSEMKVTIQAGIRLVEEQGDDYWTVWIAAPASHSELTEVRPMSQVRSGSSLGAVAARKMLGSFNGTLTIEKREDTGDGTLFVVKIPALKGQE